MKIVVIDYGIGNVKSIINAFEKQNIKAILSREKQVILEADGLILPGVGAFSHGMNNLNKYGLVPVIKEYEFLIPAIHEHLRVAVVRHRMTGIVKLALYPHLRVAVVIVSDMQHVTCACGRYPIARS